MKVTKYLVLILFVSVLSNAQVKYNVQVVDSEMTWDQSMKNLSSKCPFKVKRRQSLVDVLYYGYDGVIHQGQVLIDYRLAEDIQRVFKVALRVKFPIEKVVPIAHKKYYNGREWDDNLSMADNNSSGFNYRKVPGKRNLSKHAYGFAIDINPLDNPYITRKFTLPPGAVYNKNKPGTLYAGHPVVKEFLKLGWSWGGFWKSSKDYQHFQKIPSRKSGKKYSKYSKYYAWK